jgi:hypothetical protein
VSFLYFWLQGLHDAALPAATLLLKFDLPLSFSSSSAGAINVLFVQTLH